MSLRSYKVLAIDIGIWACRGVDLISLNDVEKYIFCIVFDVSLTLYLQQNQHFHLTS
jgi:tRNA G37 N-methylase Trm5